MLYWAGGAAASYSRRCTITATMPQRKSSLVGLSPAQRVARSRKMRKLRTRQKGGKKGTRLRVTQRLTADRSPDALQVRHTQL